MNRSISKIRHLQEVNKRLERKYLLEQDEDIINNLNKDIENLKNLTDDDVVDLEGVTIVGDKLKSLCGKIITNMEDIIDGLEDLKDEADIQTKLEDDFELKGDIKMLIKDLTDFTAERFKNDNPFGI